MDRIIKQIVGHIDVEYVPPGDKSISHRALMISAMAKGENVILGLAKSDDVLNTANILRALGVRIEENDGEVIINSPGLDGFETPRQVLDCGNSGTTMRLMAGVLAGSNISAVLAGDGSLQSRPMQRIIKPLRAMGASIESFANGDRAPLAIVGGKLQGIMWSPEVASAQVKSAILLAGVGATGKTKVIESLATRDHTERMLECFGADISYGKGWAEVTGGKTLVPRRYRVPGDISSAAFFMVLAAAIPGSKLTVRGVGLNDGRMGIIEVLRTMGANVTVGIQEHSPEPWGEIIVTGGLLRGFDIGGEMIPLTIDELPALAVAAAVAQGKSCVRNAEELRFKESDRISALLLELNKLGVKTEEYHDGFSIHGGSMRGALVDS
ncbi:MAG: 3-phosphoshikimate 1-carboxyvinyltransferase, partial [bacterium]|nr:3-phosphoshikimate 1-carboxyvinyltransferase [bacterium]